MVQSTRVLGMVLLCLALFGGVCYAFKPDEPGHVGITEQALAALGFCRHARDAVEDANVLTDIFEQLVSEAHFDDESLQAGSRRLLEKRELIVRLIRESVESEDGQDEDDDFLFLLDDEDFDLGFLETVVTTSLDVGRGFLSISDSKQSQAWTALGQALHSLQDFYSHSNWVEMGSTNINTRLGEEELDNPSASTQPCLGDPAVLDLDGDGGNTLTTSYFLFDPSAHCELLDFPGKCRHGWDFAGCASGLNKDEASRPGNAEAKAFAIDATAAYVDAILDDLRDISSEHRDRLLGGSDCDEVPKNETVVFLRKASLSASDTCDTFSIEIDEIGEDYRVVTTMENFDSITLRNPSAVVVDESLDSDDDDDEYYTVDEDDDSSEIYMKDPTPGIYTLEVCGNDDLDYTVVVTAESNVFPFHFYFTRLAGTRNEGFFPHSSSQQPVLNAVNSLSAEVYGTDLDISSFDFSLIALDGVTVLQDLDLQSTILSFDGVLFEDDIAVTTAEPFHVRVEGLDNENNRFVRVFATKELQAQTVEVQYVGEFTSFQLGPDQDEVEFLFSVTNRDSVTRDFDLSLSVADNEGAFSGAVFVTQARDVASSSVSLLGGESVTATAVLTIEDDDGLEFGDVITATFTANGDGSNSENAVDVIGQYVACRGDPICSGQGTCAGANSEVCNCFFGFSSDDCSESSGSSSASGFSGSGFSPSPGNFLFEDDEDDDDDSSAALLMPVMGMLLVLLALF